MFDTYFYNSSVRSLIVSFGQMFSNIKIVRLDATNKEVTNIQVPISYANKDKFYTRTTQDPNLDRNVMNVLPRMAFTITKMQYDSSRKLNKNNRLRFVGEDSSRMNSIPTPVPYNFIFELYAISKTNNDGLQIVEQILPYFGPEYSITIKPLPGTDVTQDVLIQLDDVNMDDNYMAPWSEDRHILYTLTFTAKSVLYGGIGSGSIIKNVTANVDINGEAEKYNAYISPFTANIDDNYTIIENWYNQHNIDLLFN